MTSEQESKPTFETAKASLPTGEITDFSDVGPEIAVSYLFSELRHGAYNNQHGTTLAETITKLTSAETKADTVSHKARLAQLIRSPLSDELWDKKAKNDEIFKLLENMLRDKKVRSMSEQRNALLRLYNLRGSFESMETGSDDQWQDVIEKLFS